MEIIIGENAGFCYGVKRAVEGTFQALKDKNKEKFYCLGELVHNNAVTNALKENGAIFIDNIDCAKSTLIVRAHGIRKSDYEYLEKENIKFIDYTCPNVLKIHTIVEEYAKEGYYIFLLGDKKHPENIGTISFCGEKSCIIDSEQEALNALENLKQNNAKKLLVVAQTTYSVEKFKIITDLISLNASDSIEIIIKNTICTATNIRQTETEKISKIVDYMIIIGGKNSSNTKKLYEIAKKNCKNAVMIESANELETSTIIESERIGIMAGASTPAICIDEVVDKVKKQEKNL